MLDRLLGRGRDALESHFSQTRKPFRQIIQGDIYRKIPFQKRIKLLLLRALRGEKLQYHPGLDFLHSKLVFLSGRERDLTFHEDVLPPQVEKSMLGVQLLDHCPPESFSQPE